MHLGCEKYIILGKMHVLCGVFRYLNDYFMNHKIAATKLLIWKIANIQFINIFQSLSVSTYRK